MVRDALEQHGGATVEERRGDGHGAHQPAEIGQPEQPVLLAHVHAVGEVVRGLDEEAAVGEHRALGPAGRPGRVDDETRPVGLDLPRRRAVTLVGNGLVPPAITLLRPGDLAAEGAMDEHGLDGWAPGHGLVGRLLQLHDLTAATKAVGRDHERGLAVGQAGRHRTRAEPREARRVDGADLRHRERRDHCLGGHRQEDPDAVALSDTESRQGVRQAVHLGRQLGVGQRPRPAVVSLPDDRGGGPAALLDMPVQAVLGEVQPAPREPDRPRLAARIVQHSRVGRRPPDAQIAHHRVPVPLGIADRPVL